MTENKERDWFDIFLEEVDDRNPEWTDPRGAVVKYEMAAYGDWFTYEDGSSEFIRRY